MESRIRARKRSIDNRQFLLAISESNLEEINCLLTMIDINFKDRDYCTPLHWAVETGNIEVINILLKEGANVHIKNKKNESPIDIAKQMNRLDIVSILETLLHIDSSMAHGLLDSKFPEDNVNNYDKSIFVTWDITFDAIKQNKHGNDALHLLNIMSYFLPNNIPIELLMIFLSTKEKLSSAIELLKEYCIVSVQHKAVSIDRLVQQVTRFKLQKQNDEVRVLQSALKILHEDVIEYKMVKHVIAMWMYAKRHKELIPVYCDLANNITATLRSCGQLDKAYSIAIDVLNILKALSPSEMDQPVRLLYARNNLAKALLNKGEYHEALKQFQLIETIGNKMPSSSINEKLTVKFSIAQTLLRLGKYQEALKLYNEQLEARQGVLADDHEEILDIRNDISHILLTLGKCEESLAISQEVYQLRKAKFGESNPNTLFAKNNIAAALGKLEKFDEALAIWNEIEQMRQTSLPKDHPSVISIKFNIATMYLAQNKPNAALKIYRELRDIQSKKFGEDHIEVMSIDIEIGRILEDQGEYEKALKLFEDAYDKFRTTLGPLHVETFKAQEGIGHTFIAQKKYEDAIKIYNDLLGKHITVFGNNHEMTLEMRRNLVNIFEEQKKYDAAIESCMEMVACAEGIYGKDHPSTFLTRSNLAWLYSYNKDFDKALITFKSLLKVQESRLGEDNIHCKDTRYNIAVTQKRANKERIVIGNELLTVMKNGDVARLEQLLSKVTNINAKDTEGRTLLHYASNAADERIIEFLLERGAEIFVTSDMGNTPLHIAVSKNRLNVVKLLLQKVESERFYDFVDAKTTSSASTALHVAAKMGNIDITVHLLKMGATFCATNKDGKTPLDVSSDTKVISVLKMIHHVFDVVATGDITDVHNKFETLPLEERYALANARNDRGSTLSEVATLRKQEYIADQLVQMLLKLN